MVHEECAGCGDIELARIETVLQLFKEKSNRVFVHSGRAYDGSLGWIENAEAANAVLPFHAIISSSNPRACPSILIADEIDNATPLFNVEREHYVTSSAVEMATAMAPLLSASKEILFVDRHFDPQQEKYRRPLQEFVRAAVLSPTKRLEYHLRGDLPSSLYAEEFAQYCNNELPQILPTRVELRLVRWQQRPGGREFHARFILTEIGGVQFDPGLDAGKRGEQTKINLLTDLAYHQEWQKYQRDGIDPNQTTYSFLDEVVVVGAA